MILILIAIPADANFLNGYALNGSVLVGYVLKIRICGDMYWWDTFAIPADAHPLNG